MSGDGTYAPKSPDLSSFYSAGPTPPAEPPDPQQLLSQPSQPNFSYLQQYPAASRFSSFGQQQPNAPNQGTHHQNTTPPQARPTDNINTTSRTPGFGAGVNSSTSTQHDYIPPRVPGQAQARYTPHQQSSSSYQQAPYESRYQYQHQIPPQTPSIVAAQAQARQPYVYPGSAADEARLQGFEIEQYEPPLPPGHHTAMPPRRAAAAAAAAQMAATAGGSSGDSDFEQQQQQQAGPSGTGTSITAAAATAGTNSIGGGGGGSSSNSIVPGPVRTKFPTARIKRIMQADEEVGKVAQQTPIAVGKALELFMVALVTRSAEVARQRNSKRVSAQMLKQVVEEDDQWDFLRDIVGKVEVGEDKDKDKAAEGGRDGGKRGSGAGRVKAESESDEDGAGGAPKRRRGGGRKKKVKGEE
ncbi:hypothetical protein VTK26DRAFT_1509 [Humicola hyalothermophila]